MPRAKDPEKPSEKNCGEKLKIFEKSTALLSCLSFNDPQILGTDNVKEAL